MVGLGTLINVAGILAGGIIGLLIGKRLAPRYQQILITALGICVIFLSIAGVMKEMLTVTEGKLAVKGTVMMIACMVAGSFIGELINIEKGAEQFGLWLKKKADKNGSSRFVEGFVSTSLTVCVGAMTIVGAINDAIFADYSTLLTKTLLDTVIVIIMTSSYGKGCIFSAIPVLVIQGGFTAFARLLQPLLTTAALTNLSLVGSVLKVGNMLPALLLAVIWAYVPLLATL